MAFRRRSVLSCKNVVQQRTSGFSIFLHGLRESLKVGAMCSCPFLHSVLLVHDAASVIAMDCSKRGALLNNNCSSQRIGGRRVAEVESLSSRDTVCPLILTRCIGFRTRQCEAFFKFSVLHFQARPEFQNLFPVPLQQQLDVCSA